MWAFRGSQVIKPKKKEERTAQDIIFCGLVRCFIAHIASSYLKSQDKKGERNLYIFYCWGVILLKKRKQKADLEDCFPKAS